MTANAKLSVVVGTYNRLEQLKVAVDSILSQTSTPTRLYITDAGSTDGTIEYLESIASDEIVPILVGERLGQARAYNEVFEEIETPYVCWLSDDNEVIDNGLDVAVRILDKHPGIGMVALKVDAPSRPGGPKPRYSGGISSIGVLNVNQGLLRTHVLRDVGGFSEWLRSFCIDTDISAKVLFRGYKIVYTKQVALHHHPGEPDTREVRRRRIESMKGPAEKYEAKWSSYRNDSMGWRARGRAWELFQKLFSMNRNSTNTVLGLNGRDWRNTLTGRYISALDPLLSLGRPYHLVQSCPRRLRLSTLPTEPGEESPAPPSARDDPSPTSMPATPTGS